jgi:hypothetical protein
VRRESVTEVAGALQRDGVIRYRRGHISVIERAGLINSVCECYAVVKRQMQHLSTAAAAAAASPTTIDARGSMVNRQHHNPER